MFEFRCKVISRGLSEAIHFIMAHWRPYVALHVFFCVPFELMTSECNVIESSDMMAVLLFI